jgi:Fe2+ transport system protein FeoA
MESLNDGDATRTLSTVRSGEHGVVRALRGGRTFCSRAANLGFTTGAQVSVIQNYGHGPMLVAVRGTRVALGRAEADNVLVDTPAAGAQ